MTGMSKKSAHFYGWRVVAAAFTVAVFGWGLGFYGPPVYLDALIRSRGWSVATVSGAITVHFLIGVLVITNLPTLHRRFGLPLVTVMGAGLLALGVLGWATAQAPWQLYAATVLSGAGWPALGAAAVNAIISPWFVRKRPAALSTAYNGASIGGVIFSPLWVALIERQGFETAALMIGGFMLLVIVGLALTVLRQTPESMGQVPDGDMPTDAQMVSAASSDAVAVRSLFRDWAFVTLSFGMAVALFAQIGLLAHLVSLLVPRLGVQGAGLAAGLSTAAAILGRQCMGWFMPVHADRRLMASLSLCVQVLGCLCLLFAASGWDAGLIAGVVLIGLGIGNATSLPPLIAQIEFSKSDTARVVAMIVALSQATYAFAPALFGFVRQTLSEQAVYRLAIALQIVAMTGYLIGRKAYQKRVEPR
jgi:MFS family permease